MRIYTDTGLTGMEIAPPFEQLYAAIDWRARTPPDANKDLTVEVKQIQSAITGAAKKNEKLDESNLTRRFRNMARISPDLLDVVVATLANPLFGLGTATRKIAQRGKEETMQA